MAYSQNVPDFFTTKLPLHVVSLSVMAPYTSIIHDSTWSFISLAWHITLKLELAEDDTEKAKVGQWERWQRCKLKTVPQ